MGLRAGCGGATTRSYDAWGKKRQSYPWNSSQEPQDASNWTTGYTGYHPDLEDAGLIDMGARLYDPKIGRFTSTDPVVARPLSVQGWSRYLYVENAPLNYVDPTGMELRQDADGTCWDLSVDQNGNFVIDDEVPCNPSSGPDFGAPRRPGSTGGGSGEGGGGGGRDVDDRGASHGDAAHHVLTVSEGDLPGPYQDPVDDRAERYARAIARGAGDGLRDRIVDAVTTRALTAIGFTLGTIVVLVMLLPMRCDQPTCPGDEVAPPSDDQGAAASGDEVEGALESGARLAAEMLGGKPRAARAVVGKLNPSALTPTHRLTMSKTQFRKLVKDIDANGIKETIKYVEHNGQKFVVDGHHRLQAAKQLRLTDVPVERVELPFRGFKSVDDLDFSDF